LPALTKQVLTPFIVQFLLVGLLAVNPQAVGFRVSAMVRRSDGNELLPVFQSTE